MPAPRTASAYARMLPALVTFVLVILVIFCLYWAKPVLIPTALALLFTFLLSPVVIWLQRRGLPRVPAVILTVLAAATIIGGIGWLFASQVVNLAEQLPIYKGNITQRIAQLREQGKGSLFAEVNDFFEDVVTAATAPLEGELPSVQAPPVEVVTTNPVLHPGAYLTSAVPLLAPIGSAGLTIVLVIFMLLKREDLRNRMLSLIGHGRMALTTKALDDAGHRISRYLFAQFCLNLGFGVVIATGLYFLSVPHALLWGVLAGLLRYIPVLGPWLAAILPVSLSLLTSEGWLTPIAVVLLFATFEVLSNLIIEPLVYGQSIGVSQAGLIVAIAFWTWLWGPLGLVLAAPLTVCLVVLGKYVPQLKFFDILLGDTPVLTADINFYQRLLAHDLDEAADIVRLQLKTLNPEQVCDRILIPALVYTKQDFGADDLSNDDAQFIIRGTREIFDELTESLDPSAAAATVVSGASQPARGQVKILACAAADEGDQVAMEMFVRLVSEQGFHVESVSAKLLVSEVVASVEPSRTAVVLIAAVWPGGLARARLLCKRLRHQHPGLRIVVGRWGGKETDHANRDALLASGADYVDISLEQTSLQILQLAQAVRPDVARQVAAASELPERTPQETPNAEATVAKQKLSA